MAPTTTAHFQFWSQLPAKLRLNVLGHLLTKDHPVSWWDHYLVMNGGDLDNVIGVCTRELLTLALVAYYKSNMFAIAPEQKLDMYHVLRFSSLANAHSIRGLSLEINHWPRQEDTVHEKYWSLGHWSFIFPASKVPDQPENFGPEAPAKVPFVVLSQEQRCALRRPSYKTAMQRSEWPRLFPNLQTFELVVHAQSAAACPAPSLNNLFHTFGMGQPHITAKHMTVRVRSEQCRPAHMLRGFSFDITCPDRPDCGCEKAIEKFLQEMLGGKSEDADAGEDV